MFLQLCSRNWALELWIQEIVWSKEFLSLDETQRVFIKFQADVMKNSRNFWRMK